MARRPATPKSRPCRAIPPKARLLVRPLEDRIAPATFTVTNAGDAGTGSGTSGDLRYCITQANSTPGPNTISAIGDTGTITLTSNLPYLSQAATIIGPGANLLTINAHGSGPIFYQQSGNLTVSGLTLTGAQTAVNEAGGAIYFQSGDTRLCPKYP